MIILEYKPECIIMGAFNNNLRTSKMPNDWRKSRMLHIFKGKGDVRECNNYRGTKLMCHSMKLWERMIDARLREKPNFHKPIWIQTGHINYRTDICFANATGEIQRVKQKAPHGFRRSCENVRSSAQGATMMEPAKENSSRSLI